MSRTLAFLDGGGEMGERIRSHDWASNALGSPEAWPHSLRTAVSLMIKSPHATHLTWGPHQICVYNTAYLPIVGNKHPGSLGQPVHEVWAEVWDKLGPFNETALGGETVSVENIPFEIGGRENNLGWFSFSYTPLLDDTGEIAGIYCVVLETTDEVLTRHQMAASRQALYDLNRSLE